MHGQLVALLRLDVAYLGYIQLVHLQAALGVVGSAESRNCHHEEKSVTTHREHGTRVLRRVRGHVHQSADAREQLSPRSVLRRRAAFGSPLVPPCQSAGAVIGTKTGVMGPEEDRVRAATLRRLIGSTEYVGLYLGKVFLSLSLFPSAPVGRARDFSAQPYSVVPPRLLHLASRSPVSPQSPAPHLLHRCIPEYVYTRVLLRPDSLPAFSLSAVTLRRASSSSRLRIVSSFFLRCRITVSAACSVRCTVLARPHQPAGVPFHPFSPPRLPHLRASRLSYLRPIPLPLRSFNPLFSSAVTDTRNKSDLCSDFDETPQVYRASESSPGKRSRSRLGEIKLRNKLHPGEMLSYRRNKAYYPRHTVRSSLRFATG